jgi:hypothetical protein
MLNHQLPAADNPLLALSVTPVPESVKQPTKKSAIGRFGSTSVSKNEGSTGGIEHRG